MWQLAQNLGGGVNTYWNESPLWLSGDGDVLVIKSDRGGGYGDQDIYYTTRGGGSWTTPQNLGPILNSSADETGASFWCNHNVVGGVIYWSSSRPGGQGGRDLWTSTDSEYYAAEPTSMGYLKATYK